MGEQAPASPYLEPHERSILQAATEIIGYVNVRVRERAFGSADPKTAEIVNLGRLMSRCDDAATTISGVLIALNVNAEHYPVEAGEL